MFRPLSRYRNAENAAPCTNVRNDGPRRSIRRPRSIAAMGRTRSAASALELMSAIQIFLDQGKRPSRPLRDTPDLAKQLGGSCLAEPSPLPLGRQRCAVLELCGQSREVLLYFGVLHVPAPVLCRARTASDGAKVQSFLPSGEPKPFQKSRAEPADTARLRSRG